MAEVEFYRCKYLLPCGRCEKKGAPCDCDIEFEPKECEHEWYNVGSVSGSKSRYEVFVCSKCDEQLTRKTVLNKKDGTYKVYILDDDT